MENGYDDVRLLLQGDDKFIYQKEDLVTLRPGRESAWRDAFVERTLQMIDCGLVRVC